MTLRNVFDRTNSKSRILALSVKIVFVGFDFGLGWFTKRNFKIF